MFRAIVLAGKNLEERRAYKMKNKSSPRIVVSTKMNTAMMITEKKFGASAITG